MTVWFLRRRRFVYVLVMALFIVGLVAAMLAMSSTDPTDFRLEPAVESITSTSAISNVLSPPHINYNRPEVDVAKEKTDLDESAGELEPSYNIHTFYYAWYGNLKFDRTYIHWNHKYLPHWDANIAKFQKKGQHSPPDDIGANFYPELGPYSSRDPEVINAHMRQIRSAGIGVIVLSWYPPGKADDNGVPVDNLVPAILDAAQKHRLKVAFHIEPYKARSDQTVHDDVKHIIDKYAKHKAFYRYTVKDGRSLPMFYIYDSYHTPAEDWAQLMTPHGIHSVRHTPYDCVFIALMVEMGHRRYIEDGGFDGFYTYFAVDGFTYGSTWRFWSQLQSFAKQKDVIFIPSVGPGYIDTNVRPWNGKNSRARAGGEYYKNSWRSALLVKPAIVSITSFNEWHEGTQIERAVPKSAVGVLYKDYRPQGPDFYLQLTKQFAEQFTVESKHYNS